MTVTEVFNRIGSTSSTLEKVNILKEGESSLLLEVLGATYDPYKTYGVVNLPDVPIQPNPIDDDKVLGMFLSVIEPLRTRKLTGDLARENVVSVLAVASERAQRVCRGILEKNLRIGVGASLVNKAFSRLIPKFEVMLAEQFSQQEVDKWAQPLVLIEPKVDGVRTTSIVNEEEVRLFSRNGQSLDRFLTILQPGLSRLGKGMYDGELTGPNYHALMTQVHRKHDDESAVDLDSIVYQIFEYLSLEDFSQKYSVVLLKDKRDFLLQLPESKHVRFDVILKGKICFKDEITALYEDFLLQGYEGAMIKNLFGTYEFKRSKFWLKRKPAREIDLEIVGVEEGSGKYKGSLGALIASLEIVEVEEGSGKNKDSLGALIASRSGEQVKVGIGFSDEQRVQLWKERDQLPGRQVEIKYQEMTQNSRGTRSLRFPVFVRLRDDK